MGKLFICFARCRPLLSLFTIDPAEANQSKRARSLCSDSDLFFTAPGPRIVWMFLSLRLMRWIDGVVWRKVADGTIAK